EAAPVPWHGLLAFLRPYRAWRISFHAVPRGGRMPPSARERDLRGRPLRERTPAYRRLAWSDPRDVAHLESLGDLLQDPDHRRSNSELHEVGLRRPLPRDALQY